MLGIALRRRKRPRGRRTNQGGCSGVADSRSLFNSRFVVLLDPPHQSLCSGSTGVLRIQNDFWREPWQTTVRVTKGQIGTKPTPKRSEPDKIERRSVKRPIPTVGSRSCRNVWDGLVLTAKMKGETKIPAVNRSRVSVHESPNGRPGKRRNGGNGRWHGRGSKPITGLLPPLNTAIHRGSLRRKAGCKIASCGHGLKGRLT